MKLVLMQPYFFPYIGYFQLMHLCDEFIVFDTVQYIKKGWLNRNRILHPTGGPAYINVPVQKFHSHALIKDIMIDNREDWQNRLLNRLRQYYKNAPYRGRVLDFVEECLEHDFSSLSELNTHLLRKTCQHLDIGCRITPLSQSNIEYPPVASPDEWGLVVCKALSAIAYINAPGGIAFFNPDKYKKENIDIQFIKPLLKCYNQQRNQFEPGLSIIDVMMFNEIHEIRNMLLDYEEIY